MPAAEAHRWLHDLRKAVNSAQLVEAKRWIMENHGGSRLPFLRARALLLHESVRFQSVVCALVILGFCVDILEAQLLPAAGDPLANIFTYVDVSLNVFFVVEVRCVGCLLSPRPEREAIHDLMMPRVSAEIWSICIKHQGRQHARQRGPAGR